MYSSAGLSTTTSLGHASWLRQTLPCTYSCNGLRSIYFPQFICTKHSWSLYVIERWPVPLSNLHPRACWAQDQADKDMERAWNKVLKDPHCAESGSGVCEMRGTARPASGRATVWGVGAHRSKGLSPVTQPQQIEVLQEPGDWVDEV